MLIWSFKKRQNPTVPLGNFLFSKNLPKSTVPLRRIQFFLSKNDREEGQSHRTVTFLDILYPNACQTKTAKHRCTTEWQLFGFLQKPSKSTVPLGFLQFWLKALKMSIFFNNFEKQGAQRLRSINGPPRDGPGGGSIPPYRYASWNFASERFLKKNIKKWQS